jgi:hypothetical protein
MAAGEPGPVVLELRVEQGADTYTRRVCADGRVWTRSTGGMDDGGWPAEDRDWEVLETLPGEVLASLEREIVDAGFFEAPELAAPGSTVIGGSTEIWTADVDGRRHTVTIPGVPVNEVPAVTRVSRALEQALGAAEDAG